MSDLLIIDDNIAHIVHTDNDYYLVEYDNQQTEWIDRDDVE